MDNYLFKTTYHIYELKPKKKRKEMSGLDKVVLEQNKPKRPLMEHFLATLELPMTEDDYRFEDCYEMKDDEAIKLANNMFPSKEIRVKKVESKAITVN